LNSLFLKTCSSKNFNNKMMLF